MGQPNFKLSEFLCHCCQGGADIVKQELMVKLQKLRNDFGKPMVVDCGYRCPQHNASVGGARDSAHLYGEAADIADPKQLLREFLSTPGTLEYYGLWAEDFGHTQTWVHLQIRPAKERVFEP